ncbi:hypothetical protein BH708_10390 [Brachybacterium sp. P6-10-X1]|uniref:DUF5819 family protein n=1 Tax=Brachybacterium sp. P6-10-X1 TaxID=1903186 RepID=UPI000971B4FB|nr:DUF5819 family protein [Brachybacterium sp. P6-10-X1]APX33050.1 hypothetical protein BH708_10390 [Brachybacterium sp. P6-10-X1]
MAKHRIRRFPAVVLATVGLLAAGHIGATLAYTGPDTAVKASLQPALDRYFLGPLDQGWNLFAPGPYSQDEYMLVRACVSEFDVCAGGSDAGAEFTEWRNITAEEQEAVAYNVFADRETRQSKVVHGRFWSVASDLSDDQRAMAEANHIDGDPVFGVDLYSAEASQVYPAGQLNTLRTYQRLEDAAVGLATLVMQQEYGDSVTLVEVRMLREPVPDFDQRHDPPEEQTQYWRTIGWRPAMEFDDEVTAAWT